MIEIASFVFNPFQENTYLLYDETKECIIIDPGCFTKKEQEELSNKIGSLGLKPVKLINTHCHLDHIFGNKFVSEQYNISPEIHKEELPILEASPSTGLAYGIRFEESPKPTHFLEKGKSIAFGNSTIDILFTPGHSPGEICLYAKKENILMAGDVLFLQSIGRTDLPGGDHETLLNSIRTKLFSLDDNTKVYSGHGPTTSIGFEKQNNPFLN